MSKIVHDFVGEGLALELDHKFQIILESDLAVAGKVTLGIFAEEGTDLIHFCNTVIKITVIKIIF